MVLKIAIQAIYQVAVISVFLFAGPSFLPEPYSDAQRKEQGKEPESNLVTFLIFLGSSMIRSGFSSDGYDRYALGDSRHFTYCFNVFVVMTIFNIFNARKVAEKPYSSTPLRHSKKLLLMVVGVLILQGLVLTFGGWLMGCSMWV